MNVGVGRPRSCWSVIRIESRRFDQRHISIDGGTLMGS